LHASRGHSGFRSFKILMISERSLSRLIDLPRTHHRFKSPPQGEMNQRSPSASTVEFFNKIGTFRSSRDVRVKSALRNNADVTRLLDVSDVPDDFSIVSDALALLRGDQLPKQWLLRPISIAAARWPFVADGFPKTAETASHLVGAFSRSPAHPASIKANSSAATIFIRPAYP
jgi:hypothetical protein